MAKVSAELKGINILSWETFGKPVNAALSSSIQKTVYGLQKDISSELKRLYYVPGDPSRVSSIYFRRKGRGIFSAELSYHQKSIPLSKYPVKQYRITTGKRILRVVRGGKFGKANKFQNRIVSRANIATYTQIRKSGSPQLIHGKLGFMGWLHTGRRSGQTGFNGQVNTFASQIFERTQKATWQGNKRLPIHRLFGPSVLNLIKGRQMQNYINTNPKLNELSNLFSSHLKL